MNGVFLALSLGRPSSKVGEGELTPPTVAPVLTVDADFNSTTALLSWTASNKTDSPGFAYQVWMKIDNGFESVILITTNTSDSYDVPGALYETYTFRVEPFNDVGYGPSSNTASVILPGVI